MPASDAPEATGQPSPRRQRQSPSPVEVVEVSKISPRMVSVTLGGEMLSRFNAGAPTSHIKVFLPQPGERFPRWPVACSSEPPWQDRTRTAVRTYTPRKFDAEARRLEVQFLDHGEGPGSSWAVNAAAGDMIAIAGPGGRFELGEEPDRWWIGGDESAIPAIGTLLEALPRSAEVDLHIEVQDATDEVDLPITDRTALHWHHREAIDGYGGTLEAEARKLTYPATDRVWVACEAAAVRRVRRILLADGGFPRRSVTSRGYWKLGESNHPDHDYGED